jgi:tRNA dimethylallyltransferase
LIFLSLNKNKCCVAEKSKIVIVITGPTASGKTSLALRVARHFQTGIISADSRQCYREMSIGTAKPTAEQLREVKHYFVNSHSITADLNAGMFETLGLGYAQSIFAKKNIAVLCGGTGLYIKAFCEGLDEMPAVPQEVRKRVRAFYARQGIAGLQKALRLEDPVFCRLCSQGAEWHNPHRLMRALEVSEATGKSILTFRKNQKSPRDFGIIKIGLEIPRERLWQNILQRTDQMITLGLEHEVKQLMPYRSLNALQTVGYTEMFDYFDGRCSREEAVENIRIHTRQYAKRQMTWFKKDTQIHWFSPDEPENILDFLQHETANFASCNTRN